MAETSPCNVDAAFSGAFQGDGSTAITPVAFDFADFEVRRWKESQQRRVCVCVIVCACACACVCACACACACSCACLSVCLYPST